VLFGLKLAQLNQSVHIKILFKQNINYRESLVMTFVEIFKAYTKPQRKSVPGKPQHMLSQISRSFWRSKPT
jgi:hypothetical protein